MTSITSLSAWTEPLWSRNQPQVTWYSERHTDLNGPVLARWLSKADNYLEEQFPFGISSMGHHLPLSWRALPWLTASWLRGIPTVELTACEPRLTPDAVVTNSIELLEWTTSSGSVALAQTVDPLAFAWSGELPVGANDATAELMSQPDTLANPAPVSLTTPLLVGSEDLNVGALLENPHRIEAGQRVLLSGTSNTEIAVQVLQILHAGASAVIATDQGSQTLARRQERIDVDLIWP